MPSRPTIKSLSEAEPPTPPASQSHFAKFDRFTPNDNASFDDEFSRLASSQSWVPGSQRFKRERTIAMREEMNLHYFSQPPKRSQNSSIKEESSQVEDARRRTPIKKDASVIVIDDSEEDTNEDVHASEDGELIVIDDSDEEVDDRPVKQEKKDHRHKLKVDYDSHASDDESNDENIANAKLSGFQTLCQAVDVHPPSSVEACKQALKKKWVNIIDFIDAARTGAKVEVWTDFEAFATYTMADGHYFDLETARKDEVLSCFLQKVRGFGRGTKNGKKMKREPVGEACLKAISGRIEKRR